MSQRGVAGLRTLGRMELADYQVKFVTIFWRKLWCEPRAILWRRMGFMHCTENADVYSDITPENI
jgi:hypothetical protein